MARRLLAARDALAVMIAIVALIAVSVAGQAPATAKAKTWTARTSWGEPDLQGTWNFATTTPLERPSNLAGKEVLSQEEVEQLDTDLRTRQDSAPAQGDPGTYNQFWWDRGKSIGRTSLISEPADGRLPPLSAEGQRRAAIREEARRGRGSYDSYEDRPLDERCIVRLTEGPPMLPGGYNNNFQLFQQPGYVFILNEQVHSVRAIPMDGRPHFAPGVRQWAGDSRGRWDGSTLVVETTNFKEKRAFRGASEQMRLVERFTRLSADSMEYRFTVDDAATWSTPWTATIPARITGEPLYEYACHEGNYSLANVLSGARAQEKAAAGSSGQGAR
ncbi:MAG: hypothetical protein GEU82_06220 [Luteitalea sp.]|nr:hypothetical protein [Luteitalea sp.]